ncbi:MAG TPA: hypothetical protein VGS22_11955 [Thermoanaerobaculia bacterium]|jgi:carboxypeptidase C (cathepsin A)|nr:hypothetical protein [Thermoanaerobaculia bacterium]
MTRKSFVFTALLLFSTALARAEGAPAAAGEAKPTPKSEQSVTQHSLAIDGKAFAYTATAGTLIVRNGKDEPVASMGYTAYTKKDADLANRPITFAYNGGPGSSSIWLHMGALGPRRVVTVDSGPTPPPPYDVVDNPWSVIDKTDLVMIDPVGTGFSRAVGDAKDKDFWGVDQDIESISRFIKEYVSTNGRWRSPKFLLGESYGSTRSGGIAKYLETEVNMGLNGVILVSVALDIEAIFAWPGNDRPYPLILPSFAAVAAFHKALPNPPGELEPFLDEVRAFALGEYSAALAKGDRLSDPERDALAEKLHRYTGLSADFWKRAKFRVRESQFTQELLRGKGEVVGRLDARFLGRSYDQLAEEADYDPQSAAISAAFTSALFDYLHNDLKFGDGKTYNVSSDQAGRSWDWKHNTGWFVPVPIPNTGIDLGEAMVYNPNLRLLVLNGLYDLATPFFATESMIDHLGLPADLRSHVEMKYYPAGHMMYLHEPSLKAWKADIAAFIDGASHK